MGNCIGGPKDEVDDIVRKRKKPLRILLLGSGESGKTTFMKQLRILYPDHPFELAEKKQIKEFALMNVLEGAYYIIQGGRKDENLRIQDPVAQAAARTVMTAFEAPQRVAASDKDGSAILSKSILNLTQEVVDAINVLMHDEQFIKTMASPNLQVQDSWFYFAEQLKRYPEWGGEDWLPNETDILHTRVRTIGANHRDFLIGKPGAQRPITVTDVGGQRSERNKWIKLFTNVNGVIYMQSLGEYDQTLFEQQDFPRLVDSLQQFQSTVNQKAFDESPITLVLNKKDVLRKKFIENRIPFPPSLGTESLPVPEYTGEVSPENDEKNMDKAIDWFKAMFRTKTSREIYVQVATAIDTKIMDQVVESVLVEIIENKLKDNGLLG